MSELLHLPQSTGEEQLFSQMFLAEFIHSLNQGNEISSAVDSISETDLLYSDLELLAPTVANPYQLLIPTVISEPDYHAQEFSVRASQLPNKMIVFSDPLVNVFLVTATYQFEGNQRFFLMCPDSFGASRPWAKLKGNKLVFTWIQETLDLSIVPPAAQQRFSVIQHNLVQLQKMAEEYNTSLQRNVHNLLAQRQNRLWQIKEQLAKLGKKVFEPLKAQKAVQAQARKTTIEQFHIDLEPTKFTFPSQTYEAIIEGLRRASVMMTRIKPLVDPTIAEEELRDLILTALSVGFPQATGETFNKSGKTDINIRVGTQTAFIAECKFWDGPSQFNNTLDQLFGYLTWHDGKSAVLLFNRNKKLSNVLEQIPDLIKSYPVYKSDYKQVSETEFGAHFSHPDDSKRTVVTTFLIWDLPKLT